MAVCLEGGPYVTAGEVTALEHEVGDDTVERRALVAEALLAGAESAEVLGGLGDNVVKEVEVDATGLLCGEGRVNAKLHPTATAIERGTGAGA